MKKYSSKQGSQLVKTANGYKFKISKSEWQRIGKQAGWFKSAQMNADDLSSQWDADDQQRGNPITGFGDEPNFVTPKNGQKVKVKERGMQSVEEMEDAIVVNMQPHAAILRGRSSYFYIEEPYAVQEEAGEVTVSSRNSTEAIRVDSLEKAKQMASERSILG